MPWIVGYCQGVLPFCRQDEERGSTLAHLPICPSVNAPNGKNCVWLKPELVAQIEFTEWTPDGHLRHSKFVGLREDKEAR